MKSCPGWLFICCQRRKDVNQKYSITIFLFSHFNATSEDKMNSALIKKLFCFLFPIFILLSGCSDTNPPLATLPTETATPTSPPATPGTISGPLNFILMIDETQGWGIAAQSVLRTENGGKSWSDVTPTGIESVESTIPTPAPQGLNSMELKEAFLDAQTA
jgi:hypothetical protein